ncbi:hypothetical protein BD626DRAFT_636267 [Schizophyllum amplum]|uniref:Uncharacterized protein n=1 Tax=Schizophyllum amplum TaxID=97359 RepID=A0A550BTK9_9AGAR|nr:hypothetical protein BD626DRAFT_636267 [Auriculariopsis ampla]
MFAVVLSAAPPRSVGPAAYMKVDEQPTDDAVTGVPLAGHTRCHVHAAPPSHERNESAYIQVLGGLPHTEGTRTTPSGCAILDWQASARSWQRVIRVHAHAPTAYIERRCACTLVQVGMPHAAENLHGAALRLPCYIRAGEHSELGGIGGRPWLWAPSEPDDVARHSHIIDRWIAPGIVGSFWVGHFSLGLILCARRCSRPPSLLAYPVRSI